MESTTEKRKKKKKQTALFFFFPLLTRNQQVLAQQHRRDCSHRTLGWGGVCEDILVQAPQWGPGAPSWVLEGVPFPRALWHPQVQSLTQALLQGWGKRGDPLTKGQLLCGEGMWGTDFPLASGQWLLAADQSPGLVPNIPGTASLHPRLTLSLHPNILGTSFLHSRGIIPASQGHMVRASQHSGWTASQHPNIPGMASLHPGIPERHPPCIPGIHHPCIPKSQVWIPPPATHTHTFWAHSVPASWACRIPPSQDPGDITGPQA